MTLKRMLGLATAVGLGGLVAIAGPANAQEYGPGVSDDEIKIGNTAPYSGPASAYGAIGKALTAYFDMVNDQGGINGRKVTFMTLDDGYSPPRTVEQARKLVEQEEVLALFQTLGTPTNSAIHKYVNARKIPHLFLATGATKWGQPDQYPWTLGWQPTYSTEAKIYVKYLLEHVENPKIAILYQNDDYGKDYVEGFHEGLGDLAKDLIVAEEPYEVTDPTVDSQIVSLMNSGANVFFNVTTPKFAAQAIRKAYDIGWRPLHLLNNVSASVETVLKPAGMEKSIDIISSVFFKDPTDPQWADTPDYKEWAAWMEKYHPDGNPAEAFNSYGYAAAYTMHKTLEACGDNLTRENLMKQAASLQGLDVPMLLPGIQISTGPDDFYLIEQMQLAKFDGKQWQLFGDLISAE